MKSGLCVLASLFVLLSLTGCPQAVKLGSVSLQVDLDALSASQAKQSVVISSVLVEVTRDGYAPVETSLDIVNNVASGTVDDLAAGYWHIGVEAYSGTDLLFTGQADVNIVAGAVVEAQLLFDPVEHEPTTGSVRITAGLNPLPGYKAMNQNIDKVLFGAAARRLYVLDASTKTIGVYDSATANRIHDITLQEAPLSVALNYAENGVLLGYPSGRVYALDFATETLVLVGDALMQVNNVVALSDQYILVSGPGQYDDDFKTMSLTTGQIVSTKTCWYSLNELSVNPVAHVVYGHSIGVSPADIIRIPVDVATGAIGTIADSRYHGDFALGTPLRLINSNSRICASSGNMFTCAELAGNDLVYSGSLGQSYNDLTSDDALGYIYQLAKSPLQKLLVVDQVNFFVTLTVDLLGTPYRVFNDEAGIVVLTKQDGKYFARVFSKAGLGITEK